MFFGVSFETYVCIYTQRFVNTASFIRSSMTPSRRMRQRGARSRKCSPCLAPFIPNDGCPSSTQVPGYITCLDLIMHGVSETLILLFSTFPIPSSLPITVFGKIIMSFFAIRWA